MNQSWAVGFAILELSKYLMQSRYYKSLRPAMGNSLTVLMSDTDSFLLMVPTKSADDALGSISDIVDYSNYDKTHKLHDVSRKNALGCLKNEVPKGEIARFAGVRSKTYSFETHGSIEQSVLSVKAKGIRKAYQRKIAFADFVRCLTTMDTQHVTQVSLGAKDHQIQISETYKKAYDSFDSKRYLLCAIHSCPYGSVLIRKSEEEGGCYFCRRPNLLV